MMGEANYESMLPIPQVVDLIEKAGIIVASKRTELSDDDVEEVLENLGKARAALDGKVASWEE